MSFFTRKNSFKYYLFGFLFIIISGTLLYLNIILPMESNENNIDAQEVNINIEKELVFITHYVVGNNTIQKKVENFDSVDNIQERFPEWEITLINNNQVTLERYIEDLAPDLKQGAYFSLGNDGYLTLYQKNSEEEEKQRVVETFYRIDIKKLESLLPKEPIDQLYQGIPIQDLAEYNSVISTFSEFSVD